MNDFFNSLGNNLNDGLKKLDLSIHDKVKDTFIDDFIHDLRQHLFIADSIYQLNKLPKDTTFSVNELEDNYISCYSNEIHYDIPRDMVDSNIDSIKANERLQLQNGIYKIIPSDNLGN